MKIAFRHGFLIGSAVILLASIVTAADSGVGKSAFAVMNRENQMRLAMASLGLWREDSSRGKPPVIVLSEGPPPRATGPGLQFNTQRLFYVYSDKGSSANHFAPSGWMGDWADIQIDDASRNDPADGQTCFRVTYSAQGSLGHDWAGMYWQEPRGNWGDAPGGYDLRGMKRLTFWARGAHGGEEIAAFKVGGIRGRRPDSDCAQIGPVNLSTQWQQYVIDVSDADLSKVSGGFAWAVDRFDNAGPITFYLDEIRYER
jgi:hypothetical protein